MEYSFLDSEGESRPDLDVLHRDLDAPFMVGGLR